MPLFQCLPKGGSKHLKILICRAVDDYLSETAYRRELIRHGFHISSAKFLSGDGADSLCRKLSFCFFFHPVPQIGGVIAKTLVFRKFRLSCRYQIISLTDIMDIFPCKAAAFREKRDHDLSVKTLFRSLFQRFSQDLGLHGPVAAQGRVSPADQDIVPAGLSGCRTNVPGNGPVLLPALIRSKSPGVCQEKKHPVVFPKRIGDGLPVPPGIYADVMDRLNPGGIVIQHDDDSPHVFRCLMKQLFRLRAWYRSLQKILIRDWRFFLFVLLSFHFSPSAFLCILSVGH